MDDKNAFLVRMAIVVIIFACFLVLFVRDFDRHYPPKQCPPSDTVNCMPRIVKDNDLVNPEIKVDCSQDFLQWAKKNCPGFKGAVY